MPTMTFKATPEEAARIRELARRERRSVSELLRRRALLSAPLPAPEAHEYRIEVSPVTGLPVMHAPPEAPTVTTEQIRALMADFR